jgi:hypothetical protein
MSVRVPNNLFLAEEIKADPSELESSFLSHFPDGQIEVIGSPTILPLELGNEGDASRRVLVIAAQKGMGKSKAIRAAVRACCPTPSILNVTFRRSLARGAAAEFPEGVVYLDLPDVDAFDAKRHPVLTILINSLARVKASAAHPYNVVILDEWVSILEMLGGSLIAGDARLDILSTLMDLTHAASTVIVSDALLDYGSLRALSILLGTSQITTSTTLLHYTHRNHADHQYIAYPSEESWTMELLSAIRAGRRVVVPCMTRSQALRLHGRLVQREGVSPDRALVYVSGGEHDMDHHMANLHELWKRVDVLIYSPVITAGCSFEERGHFDECFLYAFQGTATPRSALQMTFRVRDLACRRVHVWIARGERGWADTRGASRMADVLLRRAGLVQSAEEETPRSRRRPRPDDAVPALSLLSLHDAIMHYQAMREIERQHCFSLAFWRLVSHTGVRVTLAPGFDDALLADPKAQETVRKALTQLAAKKVAEFRASGGVQRTRTWQESDLAGRGLVQWSDPAWETVESPPGHPLASGHDRVATDFDPADWQKAYLENLTRFLVDPSRAPASANGSASVQNCSEVLAASASLDRSRWLKLLRAGDLAASGVRFLPLPINVRLLQPLAEVVHSPHDRSVVYVLGLQRITRSDLLDGLAVRAVFGWALGMVVRGDEAAKVAVTVRFVVSNADGSQAFIRRAQVNPFDVFLNYDAETESPKALPSVYSASATFDPMAHVRARCREGGRGLLGGHTIIDAIRPLDPTLPALHGGWSHPLSMLQALSTSDTHVLMFADGAPSPVAISCRPFEPSSIT